VTFLEAVEVYFRGERQTGIALIPIGIAMLVFGIYLWRWSGGGLGKGMGIPLAIAGLAAVIGGGFLARTVSARQASLTSAHAEAAEVPISQERERMTKVNENWKVLKFAWTGLMMLGIALVLLVKKDWVHGLALALICLTALAFVVDVFAEKRARVYADTLEHQLVEPGG